MRPICEPKMTEPTPPPSAPPESAARSTPRHLPPGTIPDLIARMRAGERLATSRIVTELERASTAMPTIIAALAPTLGRALVVGFTGPPGAGKSTLVNAYVTHLRIQGKSVAIVAVDPSSPISGGAILGDRIRMTATVNDDGVFMRSLASGGHLGGLSPAAVRIVDAFDGAGKDVIVLETVGTGQNEIDVAEVADVRVVLSAPGLGDGIQAMKSGLLEIADVLVVNKSDRPGADQTAQELSAALTLRTTVPVPKVLKTSAIEARGIDELSAEIERLGQVKHSATTPIERRRARARFLIARAATDIVADAIRSADQADLQRLTDEVLSGTASPASAARRYLGTKLA